MYKPGYTGDEIFIVNRQAISYDIPPLPKIANYLGKYKRFMPIAQAYAALSKYPGTKVGCVIVNTGSLEVRASGWNGAPRGCKADEDGRLSDRASRLKWAVHAEANAITNASRTGTPLLASTAIVTHIPCMDCAKLMIQAGVSGVVCNKPNPEFETKWGSEFTLTRSLFKECGVSLLELEDDDDSK